MKSRTVIRRTWRRYWRMKRDRFYGQGLRSDGLPRLTDRRPRTTVERQRFERDRVLRKYHARAARFAAAGLTSRGTERKYRRARIKTLADLLPQIRGEVRPVLTAEDFHYQQRENYA